MKRGRVILFLVLANLFWAGNYVFGEMVTSEVSPVSLTFWRWAFAAVPLLLLAWAIERPDWRTAVREWPMHLLQSMLGLTGYTLLLYSALGLTGAVAASVISAINPAMIALGAALFLRERLRGMQIVGIAVAFVGVVIVLTGGDLGSLVAEGFRLGDVLVVASVIAWTAYSLVARRLATPPITATAVQSVFAVVTMLPLIAVTGVTLPESAAGIAGLAYIVLFPSMLGYALWNLGAAAAGPSRAGVFLNLLPVFTVAIAVLLGQALDPVALAGGAVVVVGVYLTLRVRRVGASTDVPGVTQVR
ncbi:DMT family transporter [Agromyces sp. SYSU K20354]|uniref:DMT family transporter n=1 Tax=Agromyces cavernae TaxID=2898659 RepID=UPI001E5C89A7|nr:DMT family transporter [Agromyces cavernae]MCD2442727.1 DMT family transporter [Agromyces cavernae]